MFERLTDRARKTMALANQEAQRFNHEYIGTEHILLGLIKEGNGVAANVLMNLDIDLGNLRVGVEALVKPGPKIEPLGKLPLAPSAKKALEYAAEEACRLSHNYIGTEHLLLGLVRDGQGVAAQVLEHVGVNIDQIRQQVIELLGEPEEDEIEAATAMPTFVLPSKLSLISAERSGWVRLADEAGRPLSGRIDVEFAVEIVRRYNEFK